MKEIKFRAYDKEFNEYNDYHFNRTPLRDFTKNNTRFILEQYTGLKDKNGLEIYEGDIVKKVIELDGGVINNWEVFFGEAGFDIKRIKEDGKETTMYLKQYWKHTYEIIGNIHENPELLNQQKVN